MKTTAFRIRAEPTGRTVSYVRKIPRCDRAAESTEDIGYDSTSFSFRLWTASHITLRTGRVRCQMTRRICDDRRHVLDPADVMGPNYPSETFRVLENHEMAEFGEYRAQRLVLETLTG